MTAEDLKKLYDEIKLYAQSLEKRIEALEKGEFGTGIYLDGCSEAAKEYIENETKKEGV